MDANHIPSNSPRILVVEDEPIVQRIHKVYLEKMNYRIDIADDSHQALLLLQNSYDLILLDIGLPYLDGIDLAKEIRQRQQNEGQAYIPIIAITIYSPAEIQARCQTAGIDEIAYKPVSFTELRQLILRWLPSTAISAC